MNKGARNSFFFFHFIHYEDGGCSELNELVGKIKRC